MKRQIIITEEENDSVSVNISGVDQFSDAMGLIEVGKILLMQKVGLLPASVIAPKPEEPNIIHVADIPGGKE